MEAVSVIPIHPLITPASESRPTTHGYLTSLPPLALYIHFPWCLKKCPYCDFNSHDVSGMFAIPEQAYLDALMHDLEQALPMIWGRRIISLFIGGGTPSLMSAKGVDTLMSLLRARLPMSYLMEATLEANPGTFEAAKFASYRASGIDRLSIGIQSFNDHYLRHLGRVHDAAQARRAVELAQGIFDNFNLDLMFGLPEQTQEALAGDLQTALDYSPTHLSLYHLTLEPNTYFAKYPPVIPDHDTAAAMQDLVIETLTTGGYQHYEVSAYASVGKQARHNLNYWQFGDYLGIGPGAHSKLSFPHRILRQIRYKHPKTYLTQAQLGTTLVQEEAEVGQEALPFEFMLGALRLCDGFEIQLFAQRTGLPLHTIEETLHAAQVKGLLTRTSHTIQPTAFGRQFLTDLQAMFL